jgi:hypothetical protein
MESVQVKWIEDVPARQIMRECKVQGNEKKSIKRSKALEWEMSGEKAKVGKLEGADSQRQTRYAGDISML